MEQSEIVNRLTSVRDRFYKDGPSKDLIADVLEIMQATRAIYTYGNELLESICSLYREIKHALYGCRTEWIPMGRDYPKLWTQKDGWICRGVQLYDDLEMIEVTWCPIQNVEQRPIDGS